MNLKLTLIFFFSFYLCQMSYALSFAASPGELILDKGNSGSITLYNTNDLPLSFKIICPSFVSSDKANITISANSKENILIKSHDSGKGYIMIYSSDDDNEEISLSLGAAIKVTVNKPRILESSQKSHLVARPYQGLAITGSIVAIGMAAFGVSMMIRSIL